MQSLQLKDYQKEAVQFLLKTRTAGLFLDPGMGKTVIALKALELIRSGCVKNKQPFQAVIIAPLLVARTVWEQEAIKWGINFRFVHYSGAKKHRDAVWALGKHPSTSFEVIILTYEYVKEFSVRVSECKIQFQALIIDEASRIKTVGSQRFKGVKRMMDRFVYRFPMTGTPVPNSLRDVFGPCRIISPKVLGNSMTGFMNKHFHTTDYYGYQYALNPGAEEEIYAAISPWVLSMRSRDKLTLPELVQDLRPVFLNPLAELLYRNLETQMTAMTAEARITAPNQAVVTGKLRQVLSGMVYDDDGGVSDVHAGRYEAFIVLMDELLSEGIPALILYQFEHERDAIMALYPQFSHIHGGLSLKQITKMQEDWNNGEIPGLIGHPASMGEGLNLQAGSNHLIWFSLPWSGGSFEQTRARLYRQGQKATTVVEHIFYVPGTMDEVVMGALTRKLNIGDALFKALGARPVIEVLDTKESVL